MRCIRVEGADTRPGPVDPCDRCKRNKRPCIIPKPRPLGRKHGALGRYQGIEKAVRKIKTELRKAQASGDDVLSLPGLADFVSSEGDMRDILLSDNATQIQDDSPTHQDENQSSRAVNPRPTSSYSNDSFQEDAALVQNPSERRPHQHNEEPISNPLGLVADASGEAQAQVRQSVASGTSPVSIGSSTRQTAFAQESEPRSLARHLLRRPGYVSLGLKLSRESLELGLDTLFAHAGLTCRYSDYFTPADTNQPRDTGPDLDPVDLGLVTMEEAHYLFPMYFARLHPFNGILDPILHTPEFVRSRSALLFTWILAITSQFDHASSSMAKRLRLHGENLSKHVHAHGFKSVEIAQGYYVSLLSATPAKTMSEERSWIYTNYAFGMAAELVFDHHGMARSIGAIRDPNINISEDPYRPQRLARNRERTWLRILLWERAHSAARGRMSSFPDTEITLRIEDWWTHPLALPEDRYTCAFILLRRQLARLHDEIRRQAEFSHINHHWVRDLVDSTLRPWRQTWLAPPDAFTTPTADQVANLYLSYVYMHGRLWTLSFALHGPTSGREDSYAIKEDCFEAAVSCCEIAVRDLQQVGEPIYCMLAPTWAMISYAAVLALKLFPMLHGNRAGYEVELLALISQVALQLERAGTTPTHRFGISALLGQHLFLILRNRANVLKELAKNGKDGEERQSAAAGEWQALHRHGLQHLPNEQQTERLNDPPLLFDPLVSAFDPFLTGPPLPGEEEFAPDDAFSEMIREWFGQGFGGVI
ncbi:hypothetical protein NA57DRAFT_45781 [Rhizodiscina lignyota]|uniref:Xylanolytic transcriptional activator regulatory domain-containing protein n=1 Tax=Rhizodiscina lignyota TaxID=1504668 RepID=A0A9P4IAG2_9PEZI|nr:hypothetical protein NA57DRAFT_45781 [Rhizodiscina lignyota]